MITIAKRVTKKIITNRTLCNTTRRFLKGPIVLAYHGAYDKPIENKIIQRNHTPILFFEKQIEYLKDNYEVIPLDYLYECLINKHRLDPRQVVLTFDDGYKNNLYLVAPILQSYKMPFTVFINTKNIEENQRSNTYIAKVAILYTTEDSHLKIPFIDKELDISTPEKRLVAQGYITGILKKLPQDKVRKITDALISLIPNDRWQELNYKFYSEEPLNWDEVRQLKKIGTTIGSHCHEHIILHSNQSIEEIDFQLKRSKELIENNIGKCNYFAFPNGQECDITKEAVNELKKNNYLLAFTTIYGNISNNYSRYILPRITPALNLDSFKLAITYRLLISNRYKKWHNNFIKLHF